MTSVVAGVSTDGVIRSISTSATPTSNAYLSVVTNTLPGNVRPTVSLGTTSNQWSVGGELKLDATTANLNLAGNITATSVNMASTAGSLNMTDGKSLIASGNIRLAGATGLGLSRINGDTTPGSSQAVTLESANGYISDLTSDELANVVGAGSLSLSARSIGSSDVADIDLDVATLSSLTTTQGAAFLESLASGGLNVTDTAVSGALNLKVSTDSLRLTGQLDSGLLTAEVVAGDLVQANASVITVTGATTLLASGNISLARLVGADGDVSLSKQHS